MLWLWILGILAALIVLLCLTRVGAWVTLADGTAAVDVTVSLFHIRVFPGKETVKKAEKQTEEAAEKTKKKLPKPTFADIREAAEMLWPPLKRALGRTRRGILVKPLTLRVTLGGAEDPAGAAQLYGWLQAAVWTGMPQAERLLEIRNPAIHVGLDFDAPETRVQGVVGVSIRIGTLLAVAFGVGIPALRWFLRFRKRQKKAKRPAEAAA